MDQFSSTPDLNNNRTQRPQLGVKLLALTDP